MVLLLARHKVADAEKFIAGYTGAEAAAVRAQYGVKDDSVWATVQDNNDVLIIHHLDSEEHANAFMAADELKAAMEALGVAEAPKLQVFNKL
jgi:heme-degrading monooxygenase HmoA